MDYKFVSGSRKAGLNPPLTQICTWHRQCAVQMIHTEEGGGLPTDEQMRWTMRFQEQGMTTCPRSFSPLDQAMKSTLIPVKRNSKQLNIESTNHRFSTMSNKDASEIQEKQKQPDMMSWSSFKIYLRLITTGQAQAPFKINHFRVKKHGKGIIQIPNSLHVP